MTAAPSRSRNLERPRGLRSTPSVSLLLTVGLGDDRHPEALEWAAAQASDEVEVVVVDDGAPDGVRKALAASADRVRVVHRVYTFGSDAAAAVAAQAARGQLLVFLTARATPPHGLLDELTAPFADDPGLGAVTAGGRAQALAVALRRNALDSVGGPAALVGADNGGAVLPPAILAELARAGWREQAVAPLVAPPHRSWPRSWDAPRHDFGRLAWEPVPVAATPKRGVNVVGLLEAACGIGDAERRYTEALAKSGLAYGTFAYHGHGSPEHAYEHHGGGRFAHDTNLVVLNPETLRTFAVLAGSELWRGRYTIGVWFWELEALADRHLEALPLVNELWVSSAFLEEAFTAVTDKPVRRIPLPVRRREGLPAHERAELGLPEEFTFLTIFDFGSLAVRKNGLGVVEAFCRAFTEDEGPVLVLKTLNAALDPAGRAELERCTGHRRDIVLLDGYVSDETISEMIGRADCFVSLHRSEGFGLTPAEAMAWGRPVIATGYSGNLDFMTEENSLLIPYTMVEVPREVWAVYPEHGRWAEPDLDAAAAAMRSVVAEPEMAAALGRCARRDIRRTHSVERSARAISARYQELAARRPAARKVA